MRYHHSSQLYLISLTKGIATYSAGKINDIFNGAGINHDMGHNQFNNHGVDNLLKH